MATSVSLSNPSVEINSVDLTDQCTAASITYLVEQLENTAFGSTARTYTGGLENNTVTVTLYQSYAAAETEASIYSLVGTQTTVTVKPTNAALSATNPGFTLTGTYLETLPVLSASLGELSTIDIVFTGGVYSAATS